VYRAYGFKRCVSRRFTGPAGESDVVADVFELASPDDAYGMFTHDRDGEPRASATTRSSATVALVLEGAVLRVGRRGGRHGALARPCSNWAGRSPQRCRQAGRSRDRSGLPARHLDRRSVRFLRHAQILNTHVFVSDENVFALAPDTAAALAPTRAARTAATAPGGLSRRRAAGAAADSARRAWLGGATGDVPVPLKDKSLAAIGSTAAAHAVLGATSAGFARELLNSAPAPK